MKRNILARRAASAALAACMMFSLSAPALAASTDALLQQSTAAKSAVSVLDEENGMMEEEPAYQMNLKYGSIRVYIGADGKQYAKQGENEAQQSGNLSITTNGSPTDNTITIEGGTIGAKVTLSNVNIETTSDAAVSVSGNVELVIAGTNTLQSGWGHAGVEKADDNGTLTISGTGRMTNFTKDAPAPWADQADQITTVEVEGTVTSVGATAFKDCTALTTVNIADGVEYIEAGAFNGCTALTELNIPLSVGYIKTGAFKGCTALTSVTIRDNCRLDMNVFPDTVEVNYAEG